MWKKLKSITDALTSIVKFFAECFKFVFDILRQFSKLIITHLIAVGIGAGAIYYYEPAPQFPEVVKTVEYKTQYIKVPQSCPEFVACYQSPLKIDGKFEGDWLKVIVADDCKKNEKDFKIEVGRDNKWIVYGVITGIVVGGVSMAILK